MIKATRNQLTVAGNQYQTDAKKVLCVCAAGVLRSPTLSFVLHRKLGFNTRAVGSDIEWALIPISQALITWADEIVFVDMRSFENLDKESIDFIKDVGVECTVLNIPDDYDFGDRTLERMCFEQYTNKHNIQ